MINAREGVEKKAPSYTVGGNINLYRHQGEEYGDSLKKKKKKTFKVELYMNLQPHSWAYIWIKL